MIFVNVVAGKAILFLWAYMKLHLWLYRETVWYLESAERLHKRPMYCVTVSTLCIRLVFCHMLSLSRVVSNKTRRSELELCLRICCFLSDFFVGILWKFDLDSSHGNYADRFFVGILWKFDLDSSHGNYADRFFCGNFVEFRLRLQPW
jgi:hypothetical protein